MLTFAQNPTKYFHREKDEISASRDVLNMEMDRDELGEVLWP
jgi:hypothetical protein